jgi:hypothetical protein
MVARRSSRTDKNPFKRLTFGVEAITMARWLGPRVVSRKLHSWWAWPKGGIPPAELVAVNACRSAA